MLSDTIKRINELAAKAKTVGLTEAEVEERTRLRNEYIASVKQNLTQQLDNTYFVDADGKKHKLEKKS